MKTALLLLSLLSPLAFANGNHSENSHGGDQPTVIANGAGGSADSNIVIIVPSSDASPGAGSTGSQQSLEAGDTILSLNNQLEAVSASSASLRLSYCTTGASSQSKRGGFAVGGPSYICEIQTTMSMIITNISQHIASGDVEAAQEAFKRLDALEAQAYQYMQDRSNTASYGAWLRDIWPVFLLLLI